VQPFARLNILVILFLAIGGGCAQQPVSVPSPEPASEKSLSSSPQAPVPSKGTGLKKKAPLTVKGGDRLGWVDNALKTYPPDRFLTGLGIAPDRKTASRRSMTELKKPFTQAISGRIKLQFRALQPLPEQLNQRFAKLAEGCLQASLATATADGRVAELFIEKAPAETVYALAIVDRQASMDQLKKSIQGLDDRLAHLVNRLSSSGKPVQLNDNGELLDVFICREALDAALATVTPNGKGIPLAIQPKAIGRLLTKK
jgi:hypothetical protein